MPILYAKGLVQKDVSGEITVIVSDETVDRSGESLPVKSWDLANFNTAPRMFVDHDYRVEALTGMWKNARVEDGKLKMTPVFHEVTEIARNTKELVEKGFLNTVSVGFLQRKTQSGSFVFELLEVSWVGVPCNPNARVERLAIKDIEGNEAKAIEDFVNAFIKEMENQEAPQEPQNEPGEEKPADPTPEPQDAPVADPAPVEEGEKGMIEDTLEGARDLAMQKYAYVDPMFYRFWDFVDAYMIASTPVEGVKPMCDELCVNLQAIAAQAMPNEPMDEPMSEPMMMSIAKYLERKGFKMQKTVEADAETKAGRVLSEKNRGIIQASLDAMSGATSAIGEATSALSDLLGANEPSQGGESGDEEPADEKTVKDELRENLEVIAAQKRIVKMVVTQLGEALSQLKVPRV
jgi:HK97 family phage prohead protease